MTAAQGPTGPAGGATGGVRPYRRHGAQVTGPTGVTGGPSPTGSPGSNSTVTGPTGKVGPPGNSVTGPTGDASTVTGPTGPTGYGPTGPTWLYRLYRRYGVWRYRTDWYFDWPYRPLCRSYRLLTGPTGTTGATGPSPVSDIVYVMDNGGVVLTTGTKGYLFIDFACTITGNTVLADQIGSAVLDIWACTYAAFDAGVTHPWRAIASWSSANPTLSTASKAQDTTLTGRTTTVAAGTVLAIHLNSVSTCTRLTLALKVKRS